MILMNVLSDWINQYLGLNDIDLELEAEDLN